MVAQRTRGGVVGGPVGSWGVMAGAGAGVGHGGRGAARWIGSEVNSVAWGPKASREIG